MAQTEHDEDLELDEHLENEEGTEHEEEEEATAKVDSELEEAEDDTERDAIRERRKKERKNRQQKYREKIEAQERQLAALTASNAELQQRVASIQDVNTGAQLSQVDQLIGQANQATEHYKKIIAEATARQDGRVVAEATEYMIASRDRAKELTAYKNNATRALNAPKPLNPQLTTRAQQFLGKNTWYGGPTSADPDSKVLTALDNSLTAEGWDATTDAYWNELENRAKKYLSHRFENKPTRTPGRSPVSGGNTAATTGDKGGSFVLSKERVETLKSAGLWDDPVARKAAIKNYQEFDRNNKRS